MVLKKKKEKAGKILTISFFDVFDKVNRDS